MDVPEIEIVNVGASAGDGTGDKGRVAFSKINASLMALATALTGALSANEVAAAAAEAVQDALPGAVADAVVDRPRQGQVDALLLGLAEAVLEALSGKAANGANADITSLAGTPSAPGVDLTVAATEIPAAATVDLGGARTELVTITGTGVAISSFGSVGRKRRLARFQGPVTLTPGPSLAVPGGAPIVTAAGDWCLAVSDAAGAWRVAGYFPAAYARADRLAVLTIDDSAVSGIASHAFTLGSRQDAGIAFPVALLRPTTSNMNMALDVAPNGTPSVGSGLVTHADFCGWDVGANPNAPTYSWARIGITADGRALFGGYGSGSAPRVQLVRNGTVHATCDTDSATGKDYFAIGPTGYALDNTAGWAIPTAGRAIVTVANDTALALNRTGSDGAILNFFRTGTSVGSFTVSGSGSTFNNTSDGQLKPEPFRVPLADEIDPLALIERIRLWAFDWVDPSGNLLGVRDWGVIAQELHALLPDLVVPGAGDPGSPDFAPWQVAYGAPRLVALHLAGTQALARANRALRAENRDIRRRLDALEAKLKDDT